MRERARVPLDLRDVFALAGVTGLGVGGWLLTPGLGIALVGAALYTFAVWRM